MPDFKLREYRELMKSMPALNRIRLQTESAAAKLPTLTKLRW